MNYNTRLKQLASLALLVLACWLAQQLALANPRLIGHPSSRVLHERIPLIFGGIALLVYVIVSMVTKKPSAVALVILIVMLLLIGGFFRIL
jgi:uncharacterized phage infection (PIP) family protein YhgE